MEIPDNKDHRLEASDFLPRVKRFAQRIRDNRFALIPRRLTFGRLAGITRIEPRTSSFAFAKSASMTEG